jgi:hypothetical protein
MPRNMTEARREWCQSTVRQMELAGYEPTGILTTAFDEYVRGEISFHALCAIMRDEGE